MYKQAPKLYSTLRVSKGDIIFMRMAENLPAPADQRARRSGESVTITGWVRIQLLIVIRTRANSILMEEKNSDSRWSETAREFLSELSVPQANPTQPVSTVLCVLYTRYTGSAGTSTRYRGTRTVPVLPYDTGSTGTV